MFTAKLISCFALAASVWGVSSGADQWQLLLQAFCAVIMSLSIFLAVLRITDSDASDLQSKSRSSADALLAVATHPGRRY